jgi:hypothetical protein
MPGIFESLRCSVTNMHDRIGIEGTGQADYLILIITKHRAQAIGLV